MATRKKVTKEIDGQQVIETGTEEHEALLGIGYGGMTKVKAEQIVKEREADPHLWPFEEYEKAQAFLLALSTKPTVVSNRPGWKRPPIYAS